MIMTIKTVFQTGLGGWYVGPTPSFESPEEPGIFHIPAGAVEKSPPETWEEGFWPFWNLDKQEWVITAIPTSKSANETSSLVSRIKTWLGI